jgi:hypothetical protein
MGTTIFFASVVVTATVVDLLYKQSRIRFR